MGERHSGKNNPDTFQIIRIKIKTRTGETGELRMSERSKEIAELHKR